MSQDETVPSPDVPVATTAALFERAVREHSRRLLAIARAIVGNRASPEDVVQQALTNLYQHRERYDWREPGGLMRRSVVNESLRVLRQPRMSSVSEEHPDAPTSAVGGMIDRETVLRVRQAIDRLPEHFRAALVLCEYENMAYAQIAEVLGASIPQVKTWLHRGRKQLAGMLEEFGPARNLVPRKGRLTGPGEEK
ncbi:MAG TPA: sigma-70 family RNA polymerase sigma factor [Tepidisphaeraceae bacterium]|nr:sigma-70 family RNA polymerase sigma factor [Tepidisphaeraceae bacterium]